MFRTSPRTLTRPRSAAPNPEVRARPRYLSSSIRALPMSAAMTMIISNRAGKNRSFWWAAAWCPSARPAANLAGAVDPVEAVDPIAPADPADVRGCVAVADPAPAPAPGAGSAANWERAEAAAAGAGCAGRGDEVASVR